MGLKCLLFCVCIKSIWCLTLVPYPSVNVTRYNSQSFNCSADPTWNAVSYNYGTITIAWFFASNGKCKDFAVQSSGLYTTACDDSTRTFYLTINNVTDFYSGRTIQCRVTYNTGTSSKLESLINVQYQPTTSPTIIQTPVGPIIQGNKVTLTCIIQGGNPVATITWSCDGATQITPTGSPSTVDAISSVELVTSKNNNGQTCTCTGRHQLWTNDRTQQHTIAVYYQPTTSPTITQTPIGSIIEGNKVTLTCTIQGGNPVATITWSCDGATQITPTGSPSTVEAISSVELVTSKNNNGQTCTCTGRHQLWTNDRTQQHTIAVYYQPTTSPTITQTPIGSIIEGNKVTLTCTIQGGNPVATITWSCDGATQITPTGSPSTVEAISSVELVTSKNNNGQTCTCTGRHQLWTNDRTQQHTIAVYYQPTTSPTITQTPIGSIIEGNKVTLTCTIQGGNPVATITWSCDGATQITPTGSPSTVEAISSVELVTSKNNNGQTCTCTGRHQLWTNDRTQQHTIAVYYQPTTSPTITQTPIGSIIEGNKVTLTCTIQGGNPVATITWSCDGATQITPTGSPSTVEAISSVELVTSKNNNGQTCTCTGRHQLWTNDRTQQHTIAVYYNPEIKTLSVIDGNEIVENTTAILQCKVESNPLSKVEWTFENKTLAEGNHGVLQSNYTIQRAKCVDTGFYMCTATNIINMKSYSDKRVLQLSVRCSPRRDTMFELPEDQIRLAPGQHLKIQIHIIAYPPPVVEWQFRPTNNFIAKTLSSNCNQTSMFKHTACFEKDNVTEADFGQYSIFVHNGLGNNFSYLFNVSPQDKPTAPTVFYVVCKMTSAVVLWRSEFNGGSKQEFYVQYRRISQSSSSMLSPSIPDPGVTADLQYTVNNLVPEEIYMFQIIARNDLGDSLSKSVKCTTDQMQCQTKPAPVSQDSNGLFAAGISSLIIGFISIIFSVSFVFICRKGSRLQKGKQMRTNDYTEFTACTHCNPVVTDNYDSLTTTTIGPVAINETQTGKNINTYEECLPVTNTDHTYNSLNKQPKEKKLKKKDEIYDNMKI